jgi:gamma-glutamylcyclotransferase (GGCT)/AIG2-like uncharacterized protein YtfP
MNPVYYLFVYGSLRSDCKNEAHQYLSSYFTLIGKARVKGRLYDLGKYPAAIPTREDYFVVGELYHISDSKEFSGVMAQLDEYEEVNGTGSGQALYRRELTEVFINDLTVQAWIYWYNGRIEGTPLITSGDLLEYNRTNKIN